MTNVILISPEGLLILEDLPQPPSLVETDVRMDGTLPDYINVERNIRNTVVKYCAMTWRDWVVIMPVDRQEDKEEFAKVDHRLTRRQLDVLFCLSQGLTGKQIAGRLNVHPRSVSLHISALKQKLHANTAAECVQKAARLGILRPGGW